MVTVPVLLPDHHGREPIPWTSGFPSHLQSLNVTLVGNPIPFHVYLYIPFNFTTWPHQNGKIFPTWVVCIHCGPFDNQEICLGLLLRLVYNLNWDPNAPPNTLLISTTLSNNARHPPPPADSSLHRAVLGQWLHRLIDNLDAVAPRVSPLVALVAGQVQVARGGPSQGEGSLLLRLQLLPGHLQRLYLVLGAPGYRSGDKSHVLSPDPVLQPCRNGVGRREERELVRQLPCPLWSLPAPGFRVGAKDKARLSVSLASHL